MSHSEAALSRTAAPVSTDVEPAALVSNVQRRWWTVALLASLSVLSFVDRLILALLVAPLKADLGVSDVKIGLLFGPAFAISYAVLGLPVARLADSGNRKTLVTAGVMLWGLATVASGFVNLFWLLVALRVGLALGEAALTPAAYSMIGDLFPARQRPFAASVYTAVGVAGASGAFILGAWVVRLTSGGAIIWAGLHVAAWQLVLIIVGTPTLVIGLVFAATVREPARLSDKGRAPGITQVLGFVWRERRLYPALFLGAGLIQAIGYAYTAWGPELLRRQYHWNIQQAGFAFGVAGLLAGFSGTLAAPHLVRLLQTRGRIDAVPLVSILALLAGVAAAVAAPLQASPWAFLALQAAASFCLFGATSNVFIALQTLPPDRMRATLVAVLLLCVTLLGLGIGPPATALLSSALNPTGGALGPALAILAPVIGVPALLLMMASRHALGSGLTPPG